VTGFWGLDGAGVLGLDTGALGLSLALSFTGALQLLADMYSLANGTPLILITGRETLVFACSMQELMRTLLGQEMLTLLGPGSLQARILPAGTRIKVNITTTLNSFFID
jgi:hypothetical protein